eukprot:CAMPEP_0175658966 /NCGR_PEP_ID=MMETSP0097-20121207/13692_1 /TAXON_ID=311494 /ORGANISM="Alexandrium monilatum, Strain CCMP3105" /LENGTH=34 /DNA_ID= /DNA_START= /DNA_END= /DNA_ORIENTATION=
MGHGRYCAAQDKVTCGGGVQRACPEDVEDTQDAG